MSGLLSAVIPTHNRLDTLLRVLDSLAAQQGAPAFEVVLVDDGSTDATPRTIPRKSYPFPLRYFPRPQGGPAKARNFGVQEAQGETVAFFGDDTILDPLCLRFHHAAREARGGGVAILGYTRWHPDLRPTRFMEYINEYGLQFGFRIIPDPERVPFNFFYTSNVSLPRRLMTEQGGFDETFPYAAWEDIELAYRMEKAGMVMAYEPRAVALHRHPTTIATFLQRQRRSGLAAAAFAAKHPERRDWLGAPLARALPRAMPRPLQWKARVARFFEFTPVPVPVSWYREIMEHAYLMGLNEALERERSADSA
jgi:glycosyltransferase involved in cell wall biosynthesis